MTAFDVVVVFTAWLGAAAVVLTAVAIAALAIRVRQPVLALFGLLPVGVGILVLVFSSGMPAPPVVPAIVALGFAALAVVGGNPLTVWVLDHAAKGAVDGGTHGGILLPASPADTTGTTTREVLRGGTWIGYLERIAVVGAIVLGRWEIVAAVIAIKGLGRFSELDAPEARERFIIGTLVSMIWAAACGAIILLGLVPAIAG